MKYVKNEIIYTFDDRFIPSFDLNVIHENDIFANIVVLFPRKIAILTN